MKKKKGVRRISKIVKNIKKIKNEIDIEKEFKKSKKLLKKSNKIIDDELPTVEDGTVIQKKKHKGLSWLQKRRLKKNAEHSFLCRMFFSNGTSKEFVITTQNETFNYKGRTYYLKYTDAWFNLTQNQFELNFFDDFAVPLDREIIKQGDKAFFSVTPENLKPIIDMNYVKVLASSQQDKYLRMTATLQLITLLFLLGLLWFISRISKRIVTG